MDLLKPLLNLACTQAGIGHGGILRLDFGSLVEYGHPRLKGVFRGTWEVRSYSGSWRVFEGHRLIAGDYDDEPVIETAIGRLANRVLLEVEVSNRSSDARLLFSDSIVVEILEVSSREVCWEAVGPGVEISFGPGPTPTVSPLNEPGPGLTPDEERLSLHTSECAARWEPVLPPQAPAERSCQRCAYYIPLRGAWYFWDHGLCTNPLSPFDGKVTNVGRGCAEYAPELSDS
jgi:hypothetical protein